MGKYLKISPPKRGSKITVAKNGQLQVPDDPIVPFIQAEGISEDVWGPARECLELAVERCYANAKRLEWLEVFAGEKGNEVYGPGNWLPEDTVRAIQEYKVCIKGPLATPVGQSEPLDTVLRSKLDLFADLQPIRALQAGFSPLRDPSGLDIQVFREHTEDVYCDIEWKKGSPEAKQLINFLNQDLAKKLDKTVRPDSGIGIKPISATATKRLIRLTLDYAVRHKRRSVHFVHSGSTMKHTEGFFRDWGYEIARKEFGDYTVTEQQVRDEYDGEAPRGRVLIGDRSATDLFQELLIHPANFDLLATTNLNGAFVQSLALGAAGERGIAPHGYVGAKAAVFQATHADRTRTTEPAHENPSSVLLAGVMLFDHLGWKDSAELLTNALIKTIEDGKLTPDLPRENDEVELLSTAEFCEAVVENFEEVRKSRVRQAMKRTASMGR
ncbi:MAG: isocitrate/isopropylmalate family dehydrogenase [Myxococcota bacterium]